MRVVIADQLEIFRTGVRNLLERRDIEVVEAATLGELLARVERSCPDAVLVDLNLPPVGGIEATQQMRRRCSAPVILWAFEYSPEQVVAVAHAGAHGILRKEISGAGLVRALRGAVKGEAPVARDLTTVLLDALHGANDRAEAMTRTAQLSERERQVLGYLADGARNREIAETLAISEFTVKRHIQNILRKLELPSRHAAGALYAAAYGQPESTPGVVAR